jgi:Surface antigen variable number repeat
LILKKILFIVGCIFISICANAQFLELIQPDSSKKIIVNEIVFDGNKTTKEKIMLRELPFAAGDSLDWKLYTEYLERAKANLLNTSLFNFVSVSPIYIQNNQVIINTSVTERWYIYPLPIFELAETNFTTWWQTKDFRRTNYGGFLLWNNFRGTNQTLFATARFGYTKKFGLRYKVPYIDKNQKLGLDISANYFENYEANYLTIDNKRKFYAQIGGNAQNTQVYKARLSYRNNLYLSHNIEVANVDVNVQDSVTIYNPDYFGNATPATNYYNAAYSFVFDKRDFKSYPLKGIIFYGYLQKDGFGFIKNNKIDVTTTGFGIEKYVKLEKNIFFNVLLKGKTYWNSNVPYYLYRGLGYGELVRGYELYVINGQSYGLLKSNLKYQILAPREINLNFIPSKKFSKLFLAIYFNAFADAAKVYDTKYSANNFLSNKFLMGQGFGIDVVTYYDKVVRFEYTFNNIGEKGFFIDFKQAF